MTVQALPLVIGVLCVFAIGYRHYSAFLPTIYTELIRQCQRF